MPVDTFEMYWEAMGIVDAQDMLRSFSIADYPNGKVGFRKKVHREIHQKAYPKTWGLNQGAKMSVDQFFGKPKVKDGE